MSTDNLSVTVYEKQYEAMWDEFVMKYSVNGTFLQTRRFLNYHPSDRFRDASYMVWSEKKEIVALCPACRITQDGEEVLYSHMGSTYGGIIIRTGKWYKTHKVISILMCLEERWKEEGVTQIVLKQTPSLFSVVSQDLVEYCFYYLEYEACKELNLYVDFTEYNQNILNELSQGKRTNVHNCEKAGLVCRKITSKEEIHKFHMLLSKTLEKYGKKPVHTVDELYDFVIERLKDECEIFGIYKEEKMIAGSMMFYFSQVNTAHTQYLCADPQYNKLSPMTYAYYSMLCEMRKRGFKRVSWGIATEDSGRYLNDGLVNSKEAFGSRHAINMTYRKRI